MSKGHLYKPSDFIFTYAQPQSNNYTAVDLKTIVFLSSTKETKLRFSNGAEYK